MNAHTNILNEASREARDPALVPYVFTEYADGTDTIIEMSNEEDARRTVATLNEHGAHPEIRNASMIYDLPGRTRYIDVKQKVPGEDAKLGKGSILLVDLETYCRNDVDALRQLDMSFCKFDRPERTSHIWQIFDGIESIAYRLDDIFYRIKQPSSWSRRTRRLATLLLPLSLPSWLILVGASATASLFFDLIASAGNVVRYRAVSFTAWWNKETL